MTASQDSRAQVGRAARCPRCHPVRQASSHPRSHDSCFPQRDSGAPRGAWEAEQRPGLSPARTWGGGRACRPQSISRVHLGTPTVPLLCPPLCRRWSLRYSEVDLVMLKQKHQTGKVIKRGFERMETRAPGARCPSRVGRTGADLRGHRLGTQGRARDRK